MKQLIWNNNVAKTPFGSYVVTKLLDGDYLVDQPDGTCFVTKTEIGAKRKANHMWLLGLSISIDQPLVALFSNPSNWRKSTTKKDRIIKPHELSTKFSLLEAITVCYFREEQTVISVIKDSILIPVWQYNNYGASQVLKLVTKLAL